MSHPPPTVSVCMPVYNAGPYVRAAAESVLAQTFADFEFVIVDDGSTDDGHAILGELARRDARIRLISRPNTGYTVALNEALSVARGQYVARMDADDVSMPDRFAKQVDYLRTHPDAVLVGSRVLLIDPFGVPLYVPDHRTTHEEIDRELMAGIGWAVVHPSAMMVGAAVTDLGGYRTEFEPTEDLDLFLRLAERGRIANLPDVLLHYRQHVRSVNHTRAKAQDVTAGNSVRAAHDRRGVPLPPGWTPRVREVLPPHQEVDMWAWAALKAGHRTAARRHAMTLLRLAPLSPASWRLLYCAARGH